MTPPPSPGHTPGAPPAETPDSPTQIDAKTEDPKTEAETTQVVQEPVVDNARQADDPELADAEPNEIADDDTIGDDHDLPDGTATDAEVLGEAESSTGNDTLVPLILTLAGVLAAAAVLLVAFVLPAAKSGPSHLPIGVAASTQIQDQAKKLISQRYSTSFDVKNYSDEAALRKAINNRTIYGGLVVTQTEGKMLIAQAGSVRAANALAAVGQSLGLTVSDVKATPAKDPTGAGLVAAGLPLALAGIFPALVIMVAYRKRLLAQLGTVIAAAFVIGAGASALLTFWLGATQGANFWLLSVALSAALLSSNLLLVGLNAVGGRIATGIGIAVLVLISMPLSGLGTAPEWLPQPWGDIGQFLPAGAGATLMRNSAFFDGHAAGMPLAVLGVWALAGLLMLGLSEGLSESLTPKDFRDDAEPLPA